MPSNRNTLQREYKAAGLGLNCDAGGLSLAGVPLLRRSVGGLEPRPTEELAWLLKRGYGHDIDPVRLRRGLDVVAQALNGNDIGRAMVAAIHLRLPSLDERGAALIAFADEALNKYDPSEPRDAQGRWTSDGGSSASASAPDAEPDGMKPILISGLGMGSVVELRLVIMGLSQRCVEHAQEPRYYEKTQLCAAVYRECDWLAQLNGENSLRTDACIWPDGAAARMKFGIMVPFRYGHRF